jgi:RNA polymerase sigma-70 factor (ECF subfamily)
VTLPTSRAGRDENNERLQDLHARLAPELLNYFARRVIPVEDAADLLAETFIAAWRHISRLPASEEESRMWMYGVARNALRNWSRGQRRHHALGDQLREELLVSGRNTVRLDSAVSYQHDVHAALNMLPANQRELVELIHWDGFTLPEAARLMKTGESTARGRYQRAALRLRKQLADYNYHPAGEPATLP